MIYATEQQVVVTAGIMVIVAAVSFALGVWWGRRRGLEQAAEELRWEREQARARRTHPVYRENEPEWTIGRMGLQQAPPEVAHEAWAKWPEKMHQKHEAWLAHEDQHEWHDHPPLKYGDEGVPGCPSCEAHWEVHEDQALTLANDEIRPFVSANDGVQVEWSPPVLQPTAVLSPEAMSWTGEIKAMTAKFEQDMARLLSGTDQQLREIT